MHQRARLRAAFELGAIGFFYVFCFAFCWRKVKSSVIFVVFERRDCDDAFRFVARKVSEPRTISRFPYYRSLQRVSRVDVVGVDCGRCTSASMPRSTTRSLRFPFSRFPFSVFFFECLSLCVWLIFCVFMFLFIVN